MLADEPTGELDSATATAIFTLLRDLARSEGITIIACTHDRLVMEMAHRIEELADGRLVTGERPEVLHHVQAKEQSPFRAPTATEAEGMPTLSSLIGADTSQFVPLEEDGTAAAPAADAAPAEAEEAPEDPHRWARPERR
jgi:ABC-type glutathione transport system ATPase component